MTSANTTSTQKTPSAVSHRYAKALIELAEENKALESVEKDLQELANMVRESADLQTLVASPLLSKEKKYAAIGALAEKAKFHALTQNFLNVLVQNARLDIVAEIVTAVEMNLSERRGEIAISVTTAQDMTAKQKEDLEAALAKGVGADVSIQAKVEPSILGGMVVTVGSQMIDDSVTSKLARLKTAMAKESNQNTTELKEVS